MSSTRRGQLSGLAAALLFGCSAPLISIFTASGSALSIAGLLYGVHDHDDPAAMEAVDRLYRERQREALRRASTPLARLARFTGRRPADMSRRHRSARPGQLPLAGSGR